LANEEPQTLNQPQGQKFYHLSPLSFYLLASVETVFLYVTISLLDPWGHYPEIVQFIFCTALMGLMGVWLVKGYLSRTLAKRNAKGMLGVFALTVVFCFAAAMIAHLKPYESDVGRRLEVAFFVPFLSEETPITYKIKIIPPAYTKYKTMQKEFSSVQEENLEEDGFGPLNPAAQGSQMFISLQHARYRPILYLGSEKIAFQEYEDGYRAEAIIGLVTDWKIAIGSKLIGAGPIILIEDYKPEIEKFEILQTGLVGQNYFKTTLSDDYIISASYLKISGDIEDYEEKYDSPIKNVKSFKGGFYMDLTASHFAGKNANIAFHALDESGKETVYLLQDVKMNQKAFTNDTAQLISNIRNDLIEKPEGYLTYASEIKALSMSSGLSEQLGAAQPMYHMALRSAYWRIRGEGPYNSHRNSQQKSRRKAELKTAEKLLWDVAILLEDGAAAIKKTPLIQSLNDVKMALVRQDKLADVREKLVLAHRNYVQYLRAVNHYKGRGRNTSEELNALKQTYNVILKNTHEGFYGDAIRLNNYLLRTALRSTKDLRSSKYHAGFIALLEGKKLLKKLTNIQKTLLRYSKKALKEDETYRKNELNIASKDYVRLYPEYLNDIKEWTKTQKKLAFSLASLEKSFKTLAATSSLNFKPSYVLLTQINVNLTSKHMKETVIDQQKLVDNLEVYIEKISKIIEQKEKL
jgi:hypothetical protein